MVYYRKYDEYLRLKKGNFTEFSNFPKGAPGSWYHPDFIVIFARRVKINNHFRVFVRNLHNVSSFGSPISHSIILFPMLSYCEFIDIFPRADITP